MRSPSFFALLFSASALTACGGAVEVITFGEGGTTGTNPPDGTDAGGAADTSSPDATLPPYDGGGSDGTIIAISDGSSTDGTMGQPDDAAPPDSSALPDGSAPPSDATAPDDATDLDTSAPPADAGADSASCAPKPHAHVDGGVFCPRSKTAGGAAIDCDPATEVCCIPNDADAGPSTCVTGSTCAAKEQVWQCASPGDCAGNPSGTTCCLTVGGLTADPLCAGFEQSTGKHTTSCTEAPVCAGTIDAGKTTNSLYVVCLNQADCPAGTTCTDVRVLANGVRLCL